MKMMRVADGARRRKEGRDYGPAQYGPAMQIYVDIMKAILHCEKAEDYEALLPRNIELVKVTKKDQSLTLFDNLNYVALFLSLKEA